MTIYGRYFFYLIIDFIISTSPIYVFLCNCMLYNVTLTTKILILIALLTTATEFGIEILLVKQSVPVVRVIGFLWSNIHRFALQSTVILVLAGTQRYYIGFHGCVTEKNFTLFSNYVSSNRCSVVLKKSRNATKNRKNYIDQTKPIITFSWLFLNWNRFVASINKRFLLKRYSIKCDFYITFAMWIWN